jgi:hypothetical protein
LEQDQHNVSKTGIWLCVQASSATAIYDIFYNRVLVILYRKDSKKFSPSLRQSIARMLSEYFKADLNQEIINEPNFIREVCRQYLEGKDAYLLFPKLWKVLEEDLRFNEDEIRSAWGASLYFELP